MDNGQFNAWVNAVVTHGPIALGLVMLMIWLLSRPDKKDLNAQHQQRVVLYAAIGFLAAGCTIYAVERLYRKSYHSVTISLDQFPGYLREPVASGGQFGLASITYTAHKMPDGSVSNSSNLRAAWTVAAFGSAIERNTKVKVSFWADLADSSATPAKGTGRVPHVAGAVVYYTIELDVEELGLPHTLRVVPTEPPAQMVGGASGPCLSIEGHKAKPICPTATGSRPSSFSAPASKDETFLSPLRTWSVSPDSDFASALAPEVRQAGLLGLVLRELLGMKSAAAQQREIGFSPERFQDLLRSGGGNVAVQYLEARLEQAQPWINQEIQSASASAGQRRALLAVLFDYYNRQKKFTYASRTTDWIDRESWEHIFFHSALRSDALGDISRRFLYLVKSSSAFRSINSLLHDAEKKKSRSESADRAFSCLLMHAHNVFQNWLLISSSNVRVYSSEFLVEFVQGPLVRSARDLETKLSEFSNLEFLTQQAKANVARIYYVSAHFRIELLASGRIMDGLVAQELAKEALASLDRFEATFQNAPDLRTTYRAKQDFDKVSTFRSVLKGVVPGARLDLLQPSLRSALTPSGSPSHGILDVCSSDDVAMLFG
jgi:hypothetical protein